VGAGFQGRWVYYLTGCVDRGCLAGRRVLVDAEQVGQALLGGGHVGEHALHAGASFAAVVVEQHGFFGDRRVLGCGAPGPAAPTAFPPWSPTSVPRRFPTIDAMRGLVGRGSLGSTDALRHNRFGDVRDWETIDSELRLLAAVRRTMREEGRPMPTTASMD
jgi:hypothetical protein